MSDAFVNIPSGGSPRWKSPVATAANLPAVGNINGDVRVALDTSDIWEWNGTTWVLVAGPSGVGPAFGVIQVPNGTNPVAHVPTDTLTFTSSDSNITITGNSGTDTVDFAFTRVPGAANGLATLDGTGKVPLSQIPASLIGAVTYQGTWNASTNSPTLTSGTGTKGFYYLVSVAGNTNLDGHSAWLVGDWAVFDGTVWEQLQGGGAYITQLNGDVVAIGPGNAATTINQIQGKVVSGTTGTTNVVFSNAPTLTGSVTSSGVILEANGTASAPSYSFTSSPHDGIFSSGTNLLDFSTNSVNSWRIDASGNFIAVTDGAYSIGGATSTRPSTVNAVNTFTVSNIMASAQNIFTWGDTTGDSGVMEFTNYGEAASGLIFNLTTGGGLTRYEFQGIGGRLMYLDNALMDLYLPLVWNSDNTHDLGAEDAEPATTRPRKGYFGTSVGVGLTTMNTSALLQADSTTKGFLEPRMTTAQMNAISSPTTGLQVYVTDVAPGMYYYTGSAWVKLGLGSGSVTSVALSDGSSTPIYTISGSPVTSSGTLTFTLNTETANKVFAGPTTGSAAQPTFRSLVVADFPIIDVPHGGTGLATLTANNVILGNGTSTPTFVVPGTSGNLLTSNGTTWNSTTPGFAASIGAFGSTPNANGLLLSSGVLTMEPADGTHPGGVSIAAQTFAGVKTFSSSPIVSTLTLGSVVFAGTSGALTGNNSKFFWDNTNFRLGLGITVPVSRLHLDGGTATGSHSRYTAGTTTGQLVTDGTEFGITATGQSEWMQHENLDNVIYNNNLETIRFRADNRVTMGNTLFAGNSELNISVNRLVPNGGTEAAIVILAAPTAAVDGSATYFGLAIEPLPTGTNGFSEVDGAFFGVQNSADGTNGLLCGLHLEAGYTGSGTIQTVNGVLIDNVSGGGISLDTVSAVINAPSSLGSGAKGVGLNLVCDYSVQTASDTGSGTVNALDVTGTSFMELSGTSILNGITGVYEGKQLYLYNGTGASVIINNNSGSAVTGEKIQTASGAAFTLLKGHTIQLYYSGAFGSGQWNQILENDLTYYQRIVMTNAGSTVVSNNSAGILATRLHAAGTITSYTLTSPTTPLDGQYWHISTDKAVTLFTLSASAGQTIVGSLPTSLTIGQALRYQWVATDSEWYPN